MRRVSVGGKRLLLLLGSMALSETAAQATPFFARTYGLTCQTCHSGFPRLNAFGWAFKLNNFRIPGDERSARLAWQKTVPLAVQVRPTLQRTTPDHSTTQYTDTQLLAGGLLTRTTAFYLHHSYFIDTTPTEFPSYELWIQQTLNERNKSMLKVGQFELPYAYSPGINLTTVNPPLLFGAALQDNDVTLGAAMSGVQFSVGPLDRTRFTLAFGAPAALVSGTVVGERQFFGRFRDLFVRLGTGPPERQAGLFAYFTYPPRSMTDPNTANRGLRLGLDGALFWRGFQLQGMLVYGENSDPLGTGQIGVLRSGFVEIDRMLRPWVGVTGRWEIQTSSQGATTYTDAKTISLRFYPVPHLKLIAEYQQLDHGRSGTALAAALSF